MRAAGVSRQRSLKSVTVSARSISGPRASTSGTSDSNRTRMVADCPWNAWNTSTGTPRRVASIRKKRAGSPGTLTCSAVNAIQGSSAVERIRPRHLALT